MAEVTLEQKSLPKEEAYRQLAQPVGAVLEGVDDDVGRWRR